MSNPRAAVELRPHPDGPGWRSIWHRLPGGELSPLVDGKTGQLARWSKAATHGVAYSSTAAESEELYRVLVELAGEQLPTRTIRRTL